MPISPMMKFWQSVKEKYPDCMVFFRLGDFYELFFEDAVEASKLLDLTLTGRDCGLEERAPMCGVPYHAAESYLAKLVSCGKRVAICEQLSDPKAKSSSKDMVERGVVRVVSAGTVIENEFLDERRNNFIACAVKEQERCACAWTDITTGEFYVSEMEDPEKLLSALVNLSVSEVICNDEMLFAVKDSPEIERGLLPPFSCYLSQAFEPSHAKRALLEQFSVPSVDVLGLADRDLCEIASGALLEYLSDTQKHSLKNINKLRLSEENRSLRLDPVAVRNLEILKNAAEGKRYGSLLWLLDKTKTGMGARKLSAMLLSPPLDREEIEKRLDAVEELCGATLVRMGISEMLSGMRDIERLAGRISNGNLQPRDCVALSKSLAVVPNVKFRLAGFSSALLKEIERGLADPKALCALLDSAFKEDAELLRDGDFIKPGYNAELDELKDVKKNGERLLVELEARERERTGIRTLKVRFNRVFGYYIEVSNSFKEKVPYDYIRRQTLTNGERYTTEELKTLEEKLLGCEEKASRLEETLFKEICDVLTRNIAVLQEISEQVARLDCLLSFATVSKEYRYCRPQIEEDGALEIEEGRHPVVERISRERFVPNDCRLDGGENRTMIITGPNMAGKSTYLRQVALIVLLAHVGCFVPAKRARIPLCDRIFTRIGASDNLIGNQSTFMVEMSEVAGILRGATERSLLILDEVGRGTSTFDGLSIAWSVIEFLNEKIRAKTLFATHYHELTELEGKLEGVKNYKIGVREVNGAIVFLRKIVRGGASRSFGVEVAALAGVPEEVTSNAKKILKTLEKNDLAKRGTAGEREEPEEETPPALLSELKELEPDLLTPMQALRILSEWKEKYQ